MGDPMTTFPIGSTLRDGSIAITEILGGQPMCGRYRATFTDGPERLLVTTSSRQRVEAAQQMTALALTQARVAHLVWIGPFESELGRLDAMVEEEPAGAPISARSLWTVREAITLCGQLADALGELHEYGWIVRGLRPELTYADGAELTAVAPRHELFMMTATPPSYGVPPVFDRTYLAPELLVNRPASPASDVFSVCAMLAELVTGTHPFGDAGGFAMVERMVAGEREPWAGPAALGPLLDRGLAKDPARRPSVAELAAELARLG